MHKGSNIHERNFSMKKLLLGKSCLHEGSFLHKKLKNYYTSIKYQKEENKLLLRVRVKVNSDSINERKEILIEVISKNKKISTIKKYIT